jgi:hypothetical protein
MTLIICVTRWYTQLRLDDTTLVICTAPIVCPTPVRRLDSDHMRDSGRMPDLDGRCDSDQKARLRSFA